MVTKEHEGNCCAANSDDRENGIPTKSTVYYNPDNWIGWKGKKRIPRAALAHELQHSYDADAGIKIKSEEPQAETAPNSEIESVRIENIVRLKNGYEKRTTYGGKKFFPESLVDP